MQEQKRKNSEVGMDKKHPFEKAVIGVIVGFLMLLGALVMLLAVNVSSDVCIVNGIEQVVSKSDEQYVYIRKDGATVTYTYTTDFLGKKHEALNVEFGDKCPGSTFNGKGSK